MISFLTDKPQGFVTLVSCDSKYLREHAPAFLASCGHHGMDAHVHLINPDESDVATINTLISVVTSKWNISVTASSEQSVPCNIAHYASNRFLVAPEILKCVDQLLIVDIDSVFVQHWDPFVEPCIGIFLRDPLPGTIGWENEGTHCAAGVVYIDAKYSWFAQFLSKKITEIEKIWFSDQVAIWRTYQENQSNIVLHTFGNEFMAWEAEDSKTCVLYTGKGDRKNSQPTYVSLKAFYQSMVH